ncbi:long-chain fatty acid--CoA ligase [Castellaniella sp.]|uniref:AMP-dependent synthetase/ligase n=1 Tax=Castellaniella sp. TaxID=1955812 RepID=UPI003560AB62
MQRPEFEWQADGTSLIRLLAANAGSHPEDIAFREKDRGIWHQTSWRAAFDTVLQCAAGLHEAGLQADEPVLVLGDNRPNLYMGMVAVGALRALAMPLYPNASVDEIMLIHEGAPFRFVFAEDQEQVDKALELRERGARIDHIIYDNPRGLSGYTPPGLLPWSTLLAGGKHRLAADGALKQALLQGSGAQDAAVFIHSSGTTGRPKGLILSHRNVLSAVRSAYRGGAFEFNESVLAYLPMAWVGDFVLTLCAGLALRFTINVPEDADTVLQDLREIAPSFYLAAPRSWDGMLTGIQVRMEDSTWLKRRLYRYFMDSAIAAEHRKLAGQAPSLLDRVRRQVGEWLVMGPIKDQLGMTRLRNAFTGGEAIGEDTFVFYRALGINLRQLYGQTESSALVAMQAVDEVRLHTVGRPLPGIAVQIDDHGEILLQADSIFSAYHDNPEATRETLEHGWLHTGDAGYVEPDGHLVVLGRISEVVHTAQGERYIPNYIENQLKFSPYIKDVAVLGRDRPALAALVCIDLETVGHWAEIHGIAYISYADLSQKPPVIELIKSAVQRVNAKLPEALRVRRIVNLPKEFDADDGEVTRNRKLRRNVVEERYAAVIDAIYDARPQIDIRIPVVYETGETGFIERSLLIEDIPWI